MVRAAVEAHLRSLFGQEPTAALRSKRVTVWQWPDPELTDNAILATSGMADSAQVVPQGRSCLVRYPRTELLVVCGAPVVPELATILADLADYPFRSDTFLFWPHMLPLGRALVPGSSLEFLYLAMPSWLGADCATFQADGQRVDLLWVVPAARSEAVLFEERGSETLEKRLLNGVVDVANLSRQPVA